MVGGRIVNHHEELAYERGNVLHVNRLGSLPTGVGWERRVVGGRCIQGQVHVCCRVIGSHRGRIQVYQKGGVGSSAWLCQRTDSVSSV